MLINSGLEFDSKKAEDAGNLFYGKCAELCGPSHALMDFKVKAISRDKFDAWVTDMQDVKEPKQATSDLHSKVKKSLIKAVLAVMLLHQQMQHLKLHVLHQT